MISRAHRIGTSHAVQVITLVMKDSIEHNLSKECKDLHHVAGVDVQLSNEMSVEEGKKIQSFLSLKLLDIGSYGSPTKSQSDTKGSGKVVMESPLKTGNQHTHIVETPVQTASHQKRRVDMESALTMTTEAYNASRTLPVSETDPTSNRMSLSKSNETRKRLRVHFELAEDDDKDNDE